MILAYHLILSAYGFWLPNDPRGSWSEFVGAWELVRYGRATKVTTRESVAHVPHDRDLRLAAKTALKYRPVSLSDPQIQVLATGFANSAREGEYAVYACAILPEHMHLVVGRRARSIGRIVGHFKARGGQALRTAGIHPLQEFATSDGTPPSMWAEDYWKVFIDDPRHLRAAIDYVERNPEKEGRPRQRWEFVTRLPAPASPDAPGKPGG